MHLAFTVPSYDDAMVSFEVVSRHVRSFEKQLIQDRVRQAKQVRPTNLNYVFRDCAETHPQPADVLVDSRAKRS